MLILKVKLKYILNTTIWSFELSQSLTSGIYVILHEYALHLYIQCSLARNVCTHCKRAVDSSYDVAILSRRPHGDTLSNLLVASCTCSRVPQWLLLLPLCTVENAWRIFVFYLLFCCSDKGNYAMFCVSYKRCSHFNISDTRSECFRSSKYIYVKL